MTQLISVLLTNPTMLIACSAIGLSGWLLKRFEKVLIYHADSLKTEIHACRNDLMNTSADLLTHSRDLQVAKRELLDEIMGLKDSHGEIKRTLMEYAITTRNIAESQEKASLDLTGLFGRILAIEQAGPLTVKPLTEKALINKATEKIRQLKFENEELRKRLK